MVYWMVYEMVYWRVYWTVYSELKSLWRDTHRIGDGISSDALECTLFLKFLKKVGIKKVGGHICTTKFRENRKNEQNPKPGQNRWGFYFRENE